MTKTTPVELEPLKPEDAELIAKLGALEEALFFAGAMSIKPTDPNEVETVQITARECEIIRAALSDARAAIAAGA